MGNWDDEYDNEFGETQERREDSGPANLRKALKAEKEAKAALEAELAELRKQTAETNARLRRQDIESALKTSGVNPKVAKFIPDDVEATPEGVKAWLEAEGDVFNVQAPAQQDAQPLNEESDGDYDEDPELRAGFEAAQAASQGGHQTDPRALKADAIDDIGRRTTSFEDAAAELSKLGFDVGRF